MKTYVTAIFLFISLANAGTVETIETLLGELPVPIAFWPLNPMFGAKVFGPNTITGQFSSSNYNHVAGPTGQAGTAFELNAGGSSGYLKMNHPSFNRGNQPWTIVMYVNTDNADGTIFEFSDGAADRKAWLKQNSGFHTLAFKPGSAEPAPVTSCTLNTWQLVGVTYNHTALEYHKICNSIDGGTSVASSPDLDQYLEIGYSFGAVTQPEYLVTCFGFYDDTFTDSQLEKFKDLCEAFSDLTCSENCQPGTCVGNLAKPVGYQCTCKSGWSGDDCGIANCSPECPLGDHCVAPNVCAHTQGASMCLDVRVDDFADCTTWASQQNCLSNPSFMWIKCSASCIKYANCECASGTISHLALTDSTCGCGDMAISGRCESETNTALDCSYTCQRRLESNFTCTPEPLATALPSHASWKKSPKSLPGFGDNAGYLQIAVMECNLGYEPTVPSYTGMHVCDPFTPNAGTGNWQLINALKPTCLPIVCPDRPPEIAFASYVNYTSRDVFYFGDKVTYNCSEGRVLAPGVSPNATCNLQGVGSAWGWPDEGPVCYLPPCQPLDEGVNTYYNISANQTGGVVSYTCLTGYKQHSDSSEFLKTCQSDGSWLPSEVPVCTVATCPPPPIELHSYNTDSKSGEYVFGDTINYYCSKGASSLFIEPGTESTPQHTIQKMCLDTGQWTRKSLRCLLVPCPKPQSYEIAKFRLLNSTSVTQTLVYNMILVFECDWNAGYEPSANQTTKIETWRCNENSTWEKRHLKCSQTALLKQVESDDEDTSSSQSQAAVVAGSMIFAILAFFLGTIICLDYLTLSRDIHRLRHNFSAFIKMIRDRSRIKELHEVRQRLRSKVTKEKYLRVVDDRIAGAKMANSGLTNAALTNPALVANPFLANQPRILPSGSVDLVSNPNAVHVEGAMDMPEDLTLRFGLVEPGQVLQNFGMKKPT